jgi:hypothetical protein
MSTFSRPTARDCRMIQKGAGSCLPASLRCSAAGRGGLFDRRTGQLAEAGPPPKTPAEPPAEPEPKRPRGRPRKET